MTQGRGFPAPCLLALFLVLTSGVSAQPRGASSLGREEFVRLLECQVTLSTVTLTARGATKAEQQALLEDARRALRTKAASILPEIIQTDSPAKLSSLLDSGMLITETDREYNALRVEERLRIIKVNRILLEKIKPVTPEAEARIMESANALLSGVKATLVEDLAPHFTDAEIDAAVKDALGIVKERIAYPMTYNFKVPAAEGKVQVLLEEFNSRLSESIPRFLKRIEVAGRPDVPDAQRQQNIEYAKTSSLREIIHRAVSALGSATVDKELSEIDPYTFDPALRDLQTRLHQRGVELGVGRPFKM